MKKESLVCLAFLCFLISLMGVGCSATRESTDSSVSRAHEDTQITEHTGHGAESSTKAETEEPILQTVIIQQVRDNSITVETVVLLSKGEVDSKKIRVEFSLEDMDMSEFQDGATYTQIKDYVLEHSGLKVSNLYISQIKRKCGIEVGKNYNLPKSEDSRQPQCPPEKEKAIREAFKYFGMI